MSAGHRTNHVSSLALRNELERLLLDKKVRKLLRTRYTVDFSHEMPLTGGSTVAWGKFFLDPRLKKWFDVGKKKNQDLSFCVLRHEVVEKALRQALGMSYDRAHRLATEAERQEVVRAGMDWPAYKDTIESIVRLDEREPPEPMPEGYDYGPLRESGNIKSLRWMKK